MNVTENHVFFDDIWHVVMHDLHDLLGGTGSEAFLRLPMDAMPSGRLLPLARFIQSPLQGTIGKEAVPIDDYVQHLGKRNVFFFFQPHKNCL